MSRAFEMSCWRVSPQAAALALMVIGGAGCSTDTSRSNSSLEATKPVSQTQPIQQPDRNPRLPRHASPTSISPTSARRGAAPRIMGSAVRKPTSSANWSRNGGTAITAAAGETVDSIARLAEAASTEPHRAAADFAERWPDPPHAPNSDAREPAMINDSRGEKHEVMDPEEEMPLVWPVLTEAERAELPDSGHKSRLAPATTAAVLAVVLLFAGTILTLARRRS